MTRLPHGAAVTLEMVDNARRALIERSTDSELAFAVALPADLHDFDFLFPALQDRPGNLLPESRATRDSLIHLGRTMQEEDAAGQDSAIPAAYTYFGQFVDHDITLETVSADLPKLLSPNLAPLPLEQIRQNIKNMRSAGLDLDSIYGFPAPRDGARMQIGKVTVLNKRKKPFLRPPGKDTINDVKRERRSQDASHDRAALIGDPRNDENTIIAQMHVAFLHAHNALIERGHTSEEAERILRQHYQFIVMDDFLRRIAEPAVIDDILQNGNRIYDALAEPFFIPLEFTVAAYRFGHSMVRNEYDFNLNFNSSGESGTLRATLDRLFMFTALTGGLGPGKGAETLPENWIIEWPRFIDDTVNSNRARRIDTKLVEPLFKLTDITGKREQGDRGRLAVRNLLRGYLLRIPTGQAVARAVGETPLSAAAIRSAASSEEQVDVLRDGGFFERTPLWFYVLAEAIAQAGGQHLGRVGSIIVAEVLIGLIRRSENSILRTPGWVPSLPAAQPGTFTLRDLLKFANVL